MRARKPQMARRSHICPGAETTSALGRTGERPLCPLSGYPHISRLGFEVSESDH